MLATMRRAGFSLTLIFAASLLLASPALCQAPLPTTTVPQTPQEAAKVAWFKEAKFGMFIHWGLYSETEGYWKGDTDGHEWLMLQKHIGAAEYAKLATTFNPQHFDADKIVREAKDAGFKYIVFTSKHHEGFSMWNSASNSFNVFKATPFHRDVVAELAKACQRQGLKFCLYYSDTDWRDPDFPAKYNPSGFHGDPSPNPDMDRYIAYMKTQLTELLTSYGPLGILWFDNGGGFAGYDIGTVLHGQEMVDLVHQLQPNCLVNNRAGVPGDYVTPEQEIPDLPIALPWETCMTMNSTWGYNRFDKKWKSPNTLIGDLVDITSKGGNYLLNVGPRADGSLPDQAVVRMRIIGQWLDRNGEAIYGAGPSPFGAEFGSYSPALKDKDGSPAFVPQRNWRCTTQPGRLYVSLLNWPDGVLTLPAIANTITRAYFLDDPTKDLPFTQGADTEITLPALSPDPIVSVVCIEYSEPALQTAGTGA